MKNFLLTILTVFSFCALVAQDSYHTELQSLMQNNYGLPEADWVFFDNENQILNTAFNYGGFTSTQDATGQPFDQFSRNSIASAGANAWDAGWGISNQIAVQEGDVLLAVFYIRSEGSDGQVNFFVENNSTFAKEVILTLPISQEWRRYLIPFECMNSYNTGALNWGFHLAAQSQVIEIGGFTALNYDTDASLDDLPSEINNQFYGGWEADAPWRIDAADRIEQIRKTDLNITVNDSGGSPVENAAVIVKMVEHEFGFGSAIKASHLAGNNDYNVIYENKLLDLKGDGLSFNCVVFENDLKWPAWEDEWLVNKTELEDAVSWLRNNDLKIRGHTLVWPGATNLPNDVANNASDIDYVKNRINGHLEEIMTWEGIGTEIDEWDVLNEVVSNTTLAQSFSGQSGYPTGRELYPEIFAKAREIDPNTGLWINDFVTLSLNNGPGNGQYDDLKQFVGEIVDSGVDIEGIGFQGHIGGFPNSIPRVLETYDDFYNAYGLKAKVTEFDLPSFVDEELAANYLRDFLTATFSHPSMDGFLFWSFWDGATYMNAGSNLFRLDWSMTPAGDAFHDLLFNEWWTNENLGTANDGTAQTRVFKGKMEISYTCDGVTVRDTIDVTEATNYTITCDNIGLVSNDTEVLQAPVLVYPQPAGSTLTIELPTIQKAEVQLFDLQGKQILFEKVDTGRIDLNVGHLNGVHLLKINTEQGVHVQKVALD